jgi:hypothetical protein
MPRSYLRGHHAEPVLPLCECEQEWCHVELVIGMLQYGQLVDSYKRDGVRVAIVDPRHVQAGERVLAQTAFYAVVVDESR